MNFLKSVDWGGVVFLIVGIGLVLLFVLAALRMRKKRVAAEESKESKGRKRRPPPRRKTRTRERRHPLQRRAEAADEQPGRDEGEDEDDQDEDGDDQDGDEDEVPPGERPAAGVAVRAVDREDEQQRVTAGLAKTRGGFIARLGQIFKGKQIDEGLLAEIEEVLFTADIGVRTTQELIAGLRKKLSKKELGDGAAVWAHLRGRSAEILAGTGRTAGLTPSAQRPFVVLVVGVNGTGKTTTIGKLAARLKGEGFGVLLAAADTFRAAAVQQLEVWGERSQVPVVSGKEGADPASVVVEALKRARSEKIDVVIADTAGRLHTKVSLMEELQKVRRAIAKHADGAPHETLLVLDATTGQNAINQAQMFQEAISISGIILTKLDGTAKGGVVLGICNELKLPVRFIGIGEKIEDLREFSPEVFVDALFHGHV